MPVDLVAVKVMMFGFVIPGATGMEDLVTSAISAGVAFKTSFGAAIFDSTGFLGSSFFRCLFYFGLRFFFFRFRFRLGLCFGFLFRSLLSACREDCKHPQRF